jgi:hydroxymethylglutaryl-CoA lyase
MMFRRTTRGTSVTFVEIVEVAPRDGLQNEQRTLSTDSKIELIKRSRAAGLRRIEAVSFAHPARVPQLADAEAVMAGVSRDPNVSYSGLVLNPRGLDRAIAAGMDEINYVVLATETFSQRNQGVSVGESIDQWLAIAEAARAAGIRTAVTISAAFGCPFEGRVSPDTVFKVFDQILAGQPDEVVLADTIGVGVPGQVRELVTGCRDRDASAVLRAHFHDTRNTGIANALAAVESGVLVLDASTGGIGGCPFAPAATGNIATEDLVYLLHQSGYETGISPATVINSAVWIAEQLGLPRTPGSLARAGWFPAGQSGQ